MSEVFASGSWHVKDGKEAEFVEAWSALLRMTAGEHTAFIGATLIQDKHDPRHFVSFARWADEVSRAAWKGSETFATGHAACRVLCDDFYGSDYDTRVQFEGAGVPVAS